MGKLLVKLFIKDYKKVEDPKVREQYGKLSGIVGIITNLILCTGKIIVGIMASSISIIADGVNNLTDASSSVITLVGFKLSSMPEDEDHPYGHARIEYLAGLLISVVIILVGAMLFKSSIEKIISPVETNYTTLTICILVGAVLVKVWQARFYKYTGTAIDSLTIKAAFTDSRNDVITTLTVLAGVIITKVTGLMIDGYLGCLVALFILWSGVQLIRETSSPLLGEGPSEELVSQISEITINKEHVLGIHDLVVHNYGPGRTFASMHIEVDADGDLMESHDMVDNIEKEISNKLKIHFVAHMDPVRRNDPILNNISHIVEETIKPLEGVNSFHDLRIVPGTTHSNLIFDVVLSPSCVLKESEIRKIIKAAIQSEYPTFYTVVTFDRGYTNI